LENVRRDCFEVSDAGLSVEERLAARALREGVRENRAEDEERYGSVADYDAVLRWHCRL
jgi:hypothetical protein